MSFLERAIRNGISKGIGDAVGKAVEKAVEPKATELANKAAGQIDRAARATEQQGTAVKQSTVGLDGALANLQHSMETYATEASKNLKICPACGAGASANQKFCPSCGAKLPEQTVAQGAVCSSCGTQNKIGTKFCQDCGAKLPFAVAEEQAAADADNAILAQWEAKLPQYPKWNCGGSQFCMNEDNGVVSFVANFATHISADVAIKNYRVLARQNGFVSAGQYPSEEHLYKMIDGKCYHIDTEHCYEGGDTNPEIYFYIKEPLGGFYYKKPEEKPKTGFFGLFK